MASMRAFTASRGSSSPASIMPSIAAATASDFIFMKSTRVLSRSKTMARINQAPRADRERELGGVPSLGREADGPPQADLPVVDANVEPACGIAAHPGLVVDGRSVAAVIRKREQHAIVALPALRKA